VNSRIAWILGSAQRLFAARAVVCAPLGCKPCCLATRASFTTCVVLVMPVGGNRRSVIASLQLSATDVSARTTMKGAAKCDKHCDLQNSVNQQGFERILRFRDIPESMPASESTSVSCARRASQPPVVELCVSGVRFCAPRCLLLLLMHEVLVAAFGKQLTEHRSVPCLLLRCWWP
jgi:hypothetical protein